MKLETEKIIAGCCPKEFTSHVSTSEDLLIYTLANNIYYYDFNTQKLNIEFANSTENINILKYYNRGKVFIVNDRYEIFFNNKLFYRAHGIITAIAMDGGDLFFTSEDTLYRNFIPVYTVNSLITYFDAKDGNVIISTVDGYIHIVNRGKKQKVHLDMISMFYLFENKIFTVSHDCTGKVFDLTRLELIRLFSYKTEMNSAFYSAGNFIAAGKNNTIYWNDDCYASPIRLYNSFFNGFLYKNMLIAHSETGGFYLYQNTLRNFIRGSTKAIKSIDIASDGSFISSSADFTCRLYKNNEEIARPIIHGYSIVACRFIDGKRLVLLSEETTIRVYEPTYLIDRTSEIMWATNAELSLTNEAEYDRIEKEVNEHTLNTYFLYNESHKIYAHYFSPKDIAISKNFIFSVNRSATPKHAGIFVFNKNFEKIDYVQEHRLDINRLIISPDENYLIAISRDRSTSLYKIDRGLNLLMKFTDHKREVISGDFNLRSDKFITLGRDNTLFLYDLTSSTPISIPTNKKFSVLKFISNSTLAIGTEDGHLIFYNIERGEMEFDLKAHNKRIGVLERREGTLISGGDDGLLRVFSIK